MKNIRSAKVLEITGLTRSTRDKLEDDEKFPRRIRLSERVHVWSEAAVLEWLKQRQAESK